MHRRLLLPALAAALAAPALAQVAPLVEPKVYAVGPFDSLAIDGIGQVRLFQSERDEVVVPGDRRLVAGVSVQRSGGSVTIVLPRDPAFPRGLAQVEVHASHLTRLALASASSVSAPLSFKGDLLAIRMTGSGFAIFDRLEIGRLTVDVGGSAEARLVGRADKLQLAVAGKARVAADHLRARSVAVVAGDAGAADVWAIDELDARAADSGHVRYWGRPHVQRTIAGQGSIDDRGRR